MKHTIRTNIDWRDCTGYAPLIHADRSLFAWEWLRRHPLYRKEAAAHASAPDSTRARAAARRFGLVRFEPPHLNVPRARPLWHYEINPQVLVGATRGCVDGGAFMLDHVAHLVHLWRDERTSHLLFSDGLRAIRLDASAAAFAGEAISINLALDRLACGKLPLLAVRRLLALLRLGDFQPSLHAPEPRARRWILLLRTYDALMAGADIREIASELLGRPAQLPGWRARDPSLRSQAQRMVRSARMLANDGFRRLLGG